jgi:hypothetical protein
MTPELFFGFEDKSWVTHQENNISSTFQVTQGLEMEPVQNPVYGVNDSKLSYTAFCTDFKNSAKNGTNATAYSRSNPLLEIMSISTCLDRLDTFHALEHLETRFFGPHLKYHISQLKNISKKFMGLVEFFFGCGNKI